MTIACNTRVQLHFYNFSFRLSKQNTQNWLKTITLQNCNITVANNLTFWTQTYICLQSIIRH